MINDTKTKIWEIAKVLFITIVLQQVFDAIFAFVLNAYHNKTMGVDFQIIREYGILLELLFFVILLLYIYNKKFSLWTDPIIFFREEKIKCIKDMLTICISIIIINNLVHILLPEDILMDYLETEEVLINKNSWISFISAVIVGPVYEEIAYRGCVFNIIKKEYGVYAGILISSLLWALMHPSLFQGITMFFVGLLLSWYYNKYENLWIVIIPHVANNLLSFCF